MISDIIRNTLKLDRIAIVCSSEEWFFLQRTFGSGLRRRSKGFRAIHLNGTGGGKEQDEQQGKVLIVMKHESDLVG